VSLALYRTYRPATLDEVVGQDHVTGPLGRALDNDRVHHAYLFSGPRGCGKTSTARILARSLNCEQGPTSQPCGTCRSCLDLAATGPGSIDVIELDAASHGGVDDTRDLRERAMFAPAASRYKVYIIDEAHMVSTAGFNALLKLVEEPPPHVRFVFATTEPDKVLGTIRSRTFNYTFRLVPTKLLQAHLAQITISEGVPFDPAALTLVAQAGGGSVRDALSILGQLIAGAGPAGLTYEDVVAQLGVTDAALLDVVMEALAEADGATLFGAIDQVVEVGHDPRRFVTDLLERLRDLVVIKNVPDATTSGLLDVPEHRLEAMVAQAGRFSTAELSRAAGLVSDGLSELKGATAPRLQLELLCARLALPERTTEALDIVWETLAFLLTALVFLLIGVVISPAELAVAIPVIVAGYAGISVARAVVVYGVIGVGQRLLSRRRRTALPLGYLHVMFWAGLRGAIAIALVLSLPADLPQHDLIAGGVYGIVLITLLVQGTSAGWVVRRSGVLDADPAG